MAEALHEVADALDVGRYSELAAANLLKGIALAGASGSGIGKRSRALDALSGATGCGHARPPRVDTHTGLTWRPLASCPFDVYTALHGFDWVFGVRGHRAVVEAMAPGDWQETQRLLFFADEPRSPTFRHGCTSGGWSMS